MVFCISQHNCEKLSEYLSQIIKILKEQKEIDSVIMNSYFIHIPINSLFDHSGIIDGINIKLTIICNSDLEEINESIKGLKSRILEELNYSVVLSAIPKDVLVMRTDSLKRHINDADVIFDKTGDVTLFKNMICFLEKSEDAIEYQPNLSIRS